MRKLLTSKYRNDSYLPKSVYINSYNVTIDLKVPDYYRCVIESLSKILINTLSLIGQH